MRTFSNSTRTSFALGLICFVAVTSTGCKKKAAEPEKKVRFEVTSQIEAGYTKSESKAKGTLSAEYLSTSKQLTYTINYTGLEADQANLHHGTPTVLGKGVAVLKKDGQKYTSPLKGSIKLDVLAEKALFEDNLYINLTSLKFPAGEIRGQLIVRNKK